MILRSRLEDVLLRRRSFRLIVTVAVGLALSAVAGASWARAGGERTVFFRSPSGGVVCEMWAQEVVPDPTGEDNGVVCVIRHRRIQPDRTFLYTLHANGPVRGRRLRVRPGVIGHVLSYGASVTLHFVRCRSSVRGMRCVSLRSHHGFSASRTRAVSW
jgi:hypothetical protein